MPINQVSTVSVPEARLLLVNVWDSSVVAATEKSIRESPLGLNPMVEGNVIRINIPPLSEERRIEITRVAAKYAENSKAGLSANQPLPKTKFFAKTKLTQVPSK